MQAAETARISSVGLRDEDHRVTNVMCVAGEASQDELLRAAPTRYKDDVAALLLALVHIHLRVSSMVQLSLHSHKHCQHTSYNMCLVPPTSTFKTMAEDGAGVEGCWEADFRWLEGFDDCAC